MAGLTRLRELGREATCIEKEHLMHFSVLRIPTLDVGPNGGNLHGPDEFVEIDSLDILTRFYSRIANMLLS
jgi:succinyl-diaminopimelate desuccinylase